MTATQSQTAPASSSRRALTVWLALCVVVVALMVVVGGLTRLTGSGLSIVEWKPLSGTLPPLSETDWNAEFAAYKTSPQFRISFPDMEMPEFRHIFWLEYVHRLIGRAAGIIFLLPLIYFAVRHKLKGEEPYKLAIIFTLGFAQGAIGWFMVKSGLMSQPNVSPYLLAYHLGMGFILLALILWQTLNFSLPLEPAGGFELPSPPLVLKIFACIVLALIFLQAVIGAGVAGLHAGLTYNTFPGMDGQWVPDGLWPVAPWYKSLFEDVTTVQFCHRVMAYMIGCVIPVFWLFGRNNPHIGHLLPILFSVFIVQFLLGVLTLLFVVPTPLASLHQANALLLFGIAVTILHRLFVPLKTMAYAIGGKSAMA